VSLCGVTLIEYLQAERMRALQCFILDLEKRMELMQIFHQTQNILYRIISYFKIRYNDDEYKMMEQVGCLGQLYDAHN
jgi:hypothetical protein